MWNYDGTWHRNNVGKYSIAVLESEPLSVEDCIDVEVACLNRRWSATFITPEQARRLLDRWSHTGEALPGNYLGIPDAVVVADLTLEAIASVVHAHFDDDGSFEAPFKLLDEPED